MTSGPDLKLIGPTGNFPDGKCSPDDKGEVQICVFEDEERGGVTIAFGTKITWLCVTPDQAIQLGEVLVLRGKAMKEKRDGQRSNSGLPGTG